MVQLKIRVVLITVMFLTMLFYPAAALQRPTVMVTDYTVYPEVLMPGDTGTLTLTITNMEDKANVKEEKVETIGDVTTTIDTTTNINARIKSIRLYGKGVEVVTEGYLREEYLYVGGLGPGRSINISFAIKGIQEGTFSPYVLIDVKEGNDVRFPMLVRVDSSDVKISVVAPSSIAKGEITNIGLKVLNTRENKVEAVRIVPMTKGVRFSPSEFLIGTVKPHEVETASFNVTIGESFVVGNQIDLKFKVDYKNGDNYHESYCDIPVEVVRGYGVKLFATESETQLPTTIGALAKVTLDLVNTLPEEVESVIVKPLTKGPIYHPSEYPLGNMKSGAQCSVTFDIETSNMKPGVNNLDFAVIYRDVDGYHESDVYTLPLKVVTAIEMPETKTSPPAGEFLIPTPIVVVVALIALGAVVYIFIRRRKGKE